MKVKETTFKEAQYNHEYILTQDKFHCLGYKTHEMNDFHMFKTPLKFNQKGRTFKEVK